MTEKMTERLTCEETETYCTFVVTARKVNFRHPACKHCIKEAEKADPQLILRKMKR